MRRFPDQEQTIDQVYMAQLVEATEEQTLAIRELIEVIRNLSFHVDPLKRQ